MATKLRIRLGEKLGLTPPILGYLASVTELTEGYRYYTVRHPGGIFNLQLGDVVSNLLDLVTQVKLYTSSDTAQQDAPLPDNKELLRKLVGTLFAFTSYYNAAYDIILGCCKSEDSRPTIEVWKWLKEHSYTAENVYCSGLSEAKFFLDIFNELKHSSKRFGTVNLVRRSDNARVSGYYLESVDEGGVIMPDEKYHGNDHSARTANSFSYDLRRLYYLIYKVADVLSTALKQHFQEVYSTELPFNTEHSQDSQQLDDLYGAITSLPLVFLPNEAGKGVPVPRTAGRGENKSLVFENYKIPYVQSARNMYQVSTLLPAPDGFSRSWGLPYMRTP